MQPRHRPLAALALLVAFSLPGGPASAQVPAEPAPVGPSWSFSAFGTLGWAQSNRPWRYQRHIDENGTVQRDTLFGAQVDAQFTPEWSATLQARLAPSTDKDTAWSLRASWAFIGWRPSNDWLLRVGKLRAPLFLRSEHLDVGQTYPEARLPAEIYDLAPTSDFTGVHITRSWSLDGGDLALEAYHGQADLTKRFWLRQGLPPLQPAGAMYTQANTMAEGLVASWRAPEHSLRLGWHHSRTRRTDGSGLLVRPVLATLGPGISYWQTDNALPGPGVPMVDAINNNVLTLGGEAALGRGWHLSGEWVRVTQRDTELGNETLGSTLTLSRQWDAFTPYLRWSSLRTTGKLRQWIDLLDSTTVPAFVPGAALLNASMRLQADARPHYDQQSVALGTAYAVTPSSRIKAEWMRTRATRSSMFDLPADEPLEKRRRVDVFSLSYSFVY
ncbi:MAG: hypothetical protein HY855_23375 [Burkholderiales bacterium]|nr:hypothetical protein [Burkholderiales bacterium]